MMGSRPFRFGISFGGTPSRTELIESVKRAEDAGFSVVSSADHLSDRLAVLPLLAVVTQISSMRVSPMVIANDYKHPAVLAREAATIDVLSEGRFELGIGTGWIRDQYDAAGIRYDDARTRVDRFEEAIQVIKGCWTGGPFSFEGTHYRTDALECPKPAQHPGPPLLIAGSGRRMLSIAGKEADIVGISPLRAGVKGFEAFGPGLGTSASRVEAQLEWIRSAAGDRLIDIELSTVAHHVDGREDVAATAADLAASWGTTPEDVVESPHVYLGSVDRLIDVVGERRERYGISYVLFGGDDLGLVEPLVRRLAGT